MVEIPAELRGTWVTEAVSHRDREFIVRPDAIVFGTGRYSARENYTLVGVENAEPRGEWVSYRLTIRELDAQLSELVVEYRRGSKPELRFRNRPEIWRPMGAISAPVAPIAPGATISTKTRGEGRRGHG